MQCSILGYELAGMCFSSSSSCHMLVTFCVWNAVIYLSTVEPKSVMRDGNQGNRGIRNWEWSGTEWNKNNKNKNKGKMRYHHNDSPQFMPYAKDHGK